MTSLAVVAMSSAALNCLHIITLNPVLDQPLLQNLSSILYFSSVFIYLWLGWRDSAGQQRSRTALFLIAILVYTVAGFVNVFILQIAALFHIDLYVLHWGLLAVVTVLAPGLLTYSILVDRVLDIGFVINRTLVFAVLSALLLVAFGIIEWAVDHFIPVGWRESNVVFDAGLAVVVFLTFHRVRDAAEKAIEAVFFRKWQRQEAALRRFVREASFARQPQTLTDGFAAALRRYSDGAEASVYLMRADGDYRLAAHTGGSPPPILDPDDSLIMSIRADPRPQSPDGRGSLLAGVALIAPMVNRSEVIGLAVLEPKASQLEFRPDEVDLIGWSTRQVGLDLHALKVEELEGETSDLRKEVCTLRSLLDRSLSVTPAA